MLGGWVLLWHLGVFSSFGLDVVLPFGLGQYSLFSPLNLSFIIFFFHSFGSSGHFVGVGSHTEGRLTHREAVHAPCEDIWLGYFWRHELCCGPARLFLQPHRLATGKAKPSAGGAV